MKFVDRFLDYVKIDTESDFESNSIPSTAKQVDFAKRIVRELKELGLSDVSIDKNAYVMATLPSNINKTIPTVGFIAHMDTSPDFSGKDVKPRIITAYNGKDVILNKDRNIVLETKMFPEILQYKGQDIIVTDGTTLLGADNKAGIAEIITAIEYLIKHPEIKHGKIRIAFTPDEEIGRGANFFDVKKFGADFAYTIDGSEIGELEYENFNAAFIRILFKGISVHPGYAKNKMLNSMLIANEFISQLPKDEIPEKMDGYEGFFHLTSMRGSIEHTELQYIVRDFDMDNFKRRKTLINKIINRLQQKYGKNAVQINMTDQYYNMREIIESHKHTVELAKQAMKEVDVHPKIKPIRGGTDGARLSFMGLPTPNIFTGGHNFHGKFEFIPVLSMEKAIGVIIKIVELLAKRY